MAPITIDFSEVPDMEALEPGNYPIIVQSVTLRENSTQDGHYLNWDLMVTDGPNEGRHCFFMTSLKEKALWRLKAVFTNLDIDTEGVIEFDVDEETDQVLEPELAGMAGLAVVTNEKYQGVLRDRVEDILPIDDFDEVPPAHADNVRTSGKRKPRSGGKRKLQ